MAGEEMSPGCSSESGPIPLISVKANMILCFPSTLVLVLPVKYGIVLMS